MTKKLWKKNTNPVMNIGCCKYCKVDMTNNESFVAFMDKTYAHYDCMKKDDDLRTETQTIITNEIDQVLAEDKTYE
tara:strand:+ start:1886 stop:2113 length:228 start_codon:yes stop_codon:yes gene_type:complete